MKITISPVAKTPDQSETRITVAGDILMVDGISYDFSALPEGGEDSPRPEGDAGRPILGPVTRMDGEIQVAVRYYYDGVTAAPDQPANLVAMDLSSGALPDPILRRPDKGARD